MNNSRYIGILLIVLGIILASQRKRIVDLTLKLQQRLFGFWLLGKSARSIGYIYTPIVGSGLLIVGILLITGIL